MIEAASVPDVGAFLVRVLRLDRAALVRLRPLQGAGGADAGDAAGGVAELWARLPFGVLVARGARAAVGLDATVRAADLLAALERPAPGLPARRDAEWRWSLPSGTGREIERLAAADVRRVAAAAAATLAAAAAPAAGPAPGGKVAAGGGTAGRSVGERALRDALLDHVPFTVTAGDGASVEVPQRLVQAVIRMGFVPPVPPPDGEDLPVGVRVLGRWVGLAARYGIAWYRPGPI